MAQISVYDQENKEAGSVTLAPEVFEVPVRAEILNLVVRAQRAAWRAGTHSTLNRANMKGGGHKPWRQKGTGRARAGTNISPVWTGGAVTFGPHPRDYSFKVNKKVRRLALKMALSSRLASDNLMVVKDINLPEAKTKYFAKVKKDLGLEKTLLVAPTEAHALMLSARNVPGVTVMAPEQLNVYDVLRHNRLVLLESVIEPVTARLAGVDTAAASE
ncbi:50S ribosomal protein L4 [Desulfovibrio sp. OttesenSCG-928-M14]|nr:50S ribosomal protein L4 [Desulfovibrio sp. OttesenSCG-928-M16]MDL2216176.1 50S ribosomal protein L4 [Desulfovibrio sp. OttesenSCG-928-M14]MDL2290944.1 50S ribosomal protein L4 [Desulfovibrio sp. OttesenSCG-928-F20]